MSDPIVEYIKRTANALFWYVVGGILGVVFIVCAYFMLLFILS